MNKGVTSAEEVASGQQRITGHWLLLLLVTLFLSSCGFTPLYAEQYQRSLSADLSSVEVTATGSSANASLQTNQITRRYGEMLEAEIEDKAYAQGVKSAKQYRLIITFTEADAGLFVKPDGTASRGNLTYSSSYQLLRLKDQQVIAQGSIQRISSYNTSLTADYAAYVSIEDARRRGIIELAEDYKLRLASLLPVMNDPKAGAVNVPKPKEPLEPELRPERLYETDRTRL
jgi:hypothetical protein